MIDVADFCHRYIVLLSKIVYIDAARLLAREIIVQRNDEFQTSTCSIDCFHTRKTELDTGDKSKLHDFMSD